SAPLILPTFAAIQALQGRNHCLTRTLVPKMAAVMGAHRVILYSRRGCHLCEDAEQLLARHGLAPTLIDIDSDPVLRERYNTCVPVVLINGRERFRGRVNEILLKRIL